MQPDALEAGLGRKRIGGDVGVRGLEQRYVPQGGPMTQVHVRQKACEDQKHDPRSRQEHCDALQLASPRLEALEWRHIRVEYIQRESGAIHSWAKRCTIRHAHMCIVQKKLEMNVLQPQSMCFGQ